MPLYEFVCQSCDSEFEMIVSFSATEMPNCPECDASGVQRKMGLPAIHFKGSGWYINDSKKTKDSVVGSGGKESTSDNNASEKESKSDGNSDSKTEKSTSDTKSESTSKSSGDSGSKEKAKKPKKSTKSDT